MGWEEVYGSAVDGSTLESRTRARQARRGRVQTRHDRELRTRINTRRPAGNDDAWGLCE